MLKKILFAALVLPGLSLQAQSWDPAYFPASLMKKEGVMMVTEYETQIDDPLDQAGQGNRIRLARTMNYELHFDRNGRKVHQQNFKEGNKRHDQLAFEYDDQGRLTKSTYIYPQPASTLTADVDSGPTIQHKRHTMHFFLDNGKQSHRLVKTENEEGIQITDEVQFHYDVLERLDKQVHYIFRDSLVPDSLELFYSHFAHGLSITTKSGEKTLQRELLKFDLQNRLASRDFFNGTSQAPRYREIYSYNPRGWLEKIEYVYDWNFYQQGESVVSRENVHDDHGKLSEAIMDYGDGRRVVKYYDYSYYPPTEEQ